MHELTLLLKRLIGEMKPNKCLEEMSKLKQA